MVSLDTEETDTTASSIVLLGQGWVSGERRLVAQHSVVVGGGWSRLVVGLALLGLVYSLNVLSVGSSNVGGTGVEEDQQNASKCGPGHGHVLDTNLGGHVRQGESVLGHDSGSSGERGETGSEEQGNCDQHNDHLVDDGEAETEHVDQESKGSETKTNKQESKSKSGQVVVGVSVVDEAGWNTLGGVEVVHWRDWVGWTNLTVLPVQVVANTPEGPCGFLESALDSGGVGPHGVECVEWEVVGGA